MAINAQEEIAKRAKAGDIAMFMPLIHKLSSATHKKLPHHSKRLITVQDLRTDGIAHTVCYVSHQYINGYRKAQKDGNSAQFFTYLYVSLTNFYNQKLGEAYAQKRTVRQNFSFEDAMTQKGKLAELIHSVLRTKASDDSECVARVDAEKAFTATYKKASPNLRGYMIRWLLQPSDTKFKLNGKKFLEAKNELLTICNSAETPLTAEHWSFIQGDAVLRQQLCVRTAQEFRTSKTKASFIPYGQSVEGELAPLLVSYTRSGFAIL